MMQTNKMQIMDNMMRNLRRGDGLSNLQALQQMRQMKQPQPQTMTYMAKGGFPDVSGDGQITQKDILIGRGVIEKRYGGLTELPIQNMFFGGVVDAIKKAPRAIGKGISNIGKGISGALGGGEGTGNFLKTLAINLALNYMIPGGGAFMQSIGPFGRAGVRYLAGAYAPSIADEGIRGVTRDPFRGDKVVGGLTSAALGLAGDKYRAAQAPKDKSQFIFDAKDISPSDVDTKGLTFTGDSGDIPLGAFPEAKPELTPLQKIGKGITKVADTKIPLTGGRLDVGDVAKSGAAAYTGMTATESARENIQMERDAKQAAQRLVDRMEGQQRDSAEFARLAMEDPVLYNYVYKFANNPQTVEDIVNRMASGVGNLEDAQQFQTATFTTESGRRPGELTAAYGGGISSIINNAVGQNKQFASGMVPDTVDPRSDGMSDSETMIITDKQGKEPKGIMKISEEEYVVSAPDMALLGNGSARAGAQKLDNFRKNLRQMAYGTTKHQPRIDGNKALQSLMRG